MKTLITTLGLVLALAGCGRAQDGEGNGKGASTGIKPVTPTITENYGCMGNDSTYTYMFESESFSDGTEVCNCQVTGVSGGNLYSGTGTGSPCTCFAEGEFAGKWVAFNFVAGNTVTVNGVAACTH